MIAANEIVHWQQTDMTEAGVGDQRTSAPRRPLIRGDIVTRIDLRLHHCSKEARSSKTQKSGLSNGSDAPWRAFGGA
jgi:hypothetical protein